MEERKEEVRRYELPDVTVKVERYFIGKKSRKERIGEILKERLEARGFE